VEGELQGNEWFDISGAELPQNYVVCQLFILLVSSLVRHLVGWVVSKKD
jgi:hypothetical protein